MQEVPAPVDSAASLKPDATSLAQVAKPIPGPTARLQPAPASAARRHDVPMGATAKAVKERFICADGKRCGLFFVEWAAPHVFTATLML